MSTQFVIKYDNHDINQWQYLYSFSYEETWNYNFCNDIEDALIFSEQDSNVMIKLFNQVFPYMRVFIESID